jgi:hypothetical protein
MWRRRTAVAVGGAQGGTWKRRSVAVGGAQGGTWNGGQRRVEAGLLAGAGVWPAGRDAGTRWLFSSFVLDLIASSFLFRDLIAILFSVLVLDCFSIFYSRTCV